MGDVGAGDGGGIGTELKNEILVFSVSRVCISNRYTDLWCTQKRVHPRSDGHCANALCNIYFNAAPCLKCVKFLRSHYGMRAAWTVSKYLQFANINVWPIPAGNRAIRVAIDLSGVTSSVIPECYCYVNTLKMQMSRG